MNYTKWLLKRFPELQNRSDETLEGYINEAKSDSELLNEGLKVIGVLLIVFPVSVYLDVVLTKGLLYWLILFLSAGVGWLTSTYLEQKLMKHKLVKIVTKQLSPQPASKKDSSSLP